MFPKTAIHLIIFISQLNRQIVHNGSSLKFDLLTTKTTQKRWTLISYAFYAIRVWTHAGETEFASRINYKGKIVKLNVCRRLAGELFLSMHSRQ